ncbi:type 4a pilus biogenesis protein PilO [Candidatus Margulisiibacteriota bacterium]
MAEGIHKSSLQNTLAIAVAVLIVLWGSYTFLYSPKMREIKRLKSDLRIANQEIRLITGKDIDAKKIAETKGMLQAELEELSKKIPGEKEAPYLINSFINEVGKGLSIDFKLIKPGGIVAEGQYRKIPIIVEFESSYSSFHKYLQQLKQLPATVRVDKLDLYRSGKYDKVSIKMDLSAFVMPGGTLPAQQKGKTDLSKFDDPFFPKVKKVVTKKAKPVLPGLAYSGFMEGERRRAIINNAPMAVGDSIRGYTVVAIYKNRVILKKSGKLYTLWIK